MKYINKLFPAGLKKYLKRKKKTLQKRFMKASSYQENRSQGTRQRWDVLSARLDADDNSLLDIGCDIGTYTRAAARQGIVALGVEQKKERVQKAIRRNGGEERAAFMVFTLTPENILRLPTFDVVLFLSVYHQWVRSYGTSTAEQMLTELGRKAKRKLFFEPAGTQRKYGGGAVGFEDVNEASIRSYHLDFLDSIFPDAGKVSYLGATECRGSEPFRTLFEVAWPNEPGKYVTGKPRYTSGVQV